VQINIVFVYRYLKAVQNGIQTDLILDGFIGLFLEIIQQSCFIMLVERINYFISESYKSVNITNGTSDVFLQQLDGTAE
jgi:hypothetical protein